MVVPKFLAVDDDEDMIDVSSGSPPKSSPTPAKESPKSAAKSSPKQPKKDSNQDAQDQMNARISGVVALVAAEFHISVKDVHNTISVDEGVKYALAHNLDIFETLIMATRGL